MTFSNRVWITIIIGVVGFVFRAKNSLCVLVGFFLYFSYI